MKIISKLTRGGAAGLKLIRSEKNSGGHAGIPRNIGLRFSYGEYIMFVDSDDAITETALEELYKIAENFKADVVYCEKFYKVELNEVFTTNKEFLKPKVGYGTEYNFVSEPKLCSDDISERILDFGHKRFWTACWNFLFKRDLILKHDIYFPMLKIGEDEIFDFRAICVAQNLVRVPNIIYIWRNHSKAFSREKLPPQQVINRWVSSTFVGLEILNNLMREMKIFREHPEYKYLIFESFILGKLPRDLLPIYAQIPAWQLDDFIRNELEDVKDKTALTAFLFSRMNVLNVKFNQQNVIIYQQNKIIRQLQQRLSNK